MKKLLLAALAALATAVAADLPPNARLVNPNKPATTYCSATPFRDDYLITVKHSYARVGMQWQCQWNGTLYTGTITQVLEVNIPGITKGTGLQNASGDVLLVKVSPPLPADMPRASIGTKSPYGKTVQVTHKDGTRTNRYVFTMQERQYNGIGSLTDGLNPRWLGFKMVPKGRPCQGDSGGAIYLNGKLISVVSKSAEEMGPGGYLYGPNLAHKSSRSVLF